MILSVHAVFGAAVASLVPSHPVAAFGLGFVSHFALDFIPHKDYKLKSIETGDDKKIHLVDSIYKKFRIMRDISLVSFDAFLGILVSFLLFFNSIHPWVFLIGSISSLIPDFLTFIYLLIKHKPLGLFYHFHVNLIHSKFILKLNQLTGVLVQFCTVGVLIAIMFSIRYLLI